jgi:hypothetical protein
MYHHLSIEAIRDKVLVGVPEEKLLHGTVVMRNRYGFDRLVLMAQNLVL